MLDNSYRLKNQTHLPENGIEGALFELLDIETDKEIRLFIKVFFSRIFLIILFYY